MSKQLLNDFEVYIEKYFARICNINVLSCPLEKSQSTALVTLTSFVPCDLIVGDRKVIFGFLCVVQVSNQLNLAPTYLFCGA